MVDASPLVLVGILTYGLFSHNSRRKQQRPYAHEAEVLQLDVRSATGDMLAQASKFVKLLKEHQFKRELIMKQDHLNASSPDSLTGQFEPLFVHEEYLIENAFDEKNDFRVLKAHGVAGNGENEIVPVGPALSPGKSMIFSTKFLLKTRLTILNQNIIPAEVLVNGIMHSISEAKNFIPGALDLSSSWNLGKTYKIENKSAWTLRTEYN